MSALETTMRYKSKGKAHSSKFKSKTNKDDWSQVTDPQERRRIQNRVAQRKFRNKAKEVKERQARDAEEHVRASNFYIKPEPNEWGDENELSGLPWGSSSGFGRGRTLRRRDSNTSLLSERLSEATRRHIENSTSRPCTPSDSFPRGQSPFRPESPFYTPPSPFTDTFGNPSVNPFVLWGGLYRSPSVRDVKPAESIEANSVEESTQLENAHYFPDLAASPSVDHESSKSLSEQTSKSADPERESGGNDSHQNSDTSQVINVTNSRRVLGMPIDAHRALQAADERRARNASASARFRQRRKEKEKEASATIEKMQQQIRVLERKITSRGLFNKPFDAYRTSNVADFEKTLPDDAGSSARFRQRQKQKVQETSTVIEKMQQHIKELQCILEENGEIILHSTLPSSTSPASEDVVLKASSETCAQPPNESKADFHTTGPVKPSSVPSKSSMVRQALRAYSLLFLFPNLQIASLGTKSSAFKCFMSYETFLSLCKSTKTYNLTDIVTPGGSPAVP
ncbi:hypothetical protein B0O99DRAFT_98766 [Bisporella sp. PMI_857]|nr:hypothetical protein B0O99DRAFT_98766 [Bisporella sp. PMI_857]